MTRVLIVAASAVVRAGLEALLRSSPALEIVGAVAGGDLAHEIEAGRPDVLLIEVEHHGGEHDENVPLPVPVDGESPAVVILATGLDAVQASGLLQRGARAVLPREADADEIVAAVQAAAAGLVVLHPDTASEIIPRAAVPARSEPSTLIEPLTAREIEVLGMLAEGAGNKQIAQRLGISEHTVKFHIGSIFAKLGASSRTEAVTLGIRQGLVLL